jgi:hypothetical protein
MAGSSGIGSTLLGTVALRIGKNITGAATSRGIYIDSQIQSDVTTSARIIETLISQASGFTLTNLSHYYSGQGTLSGTVTNQYGFFASSTLTGAANNYGFFGNIAAAANRWNFYANGTAINYMNGALLLGSTTDDGVNKLQVTGSARITTSVSAESIVGTRTSTVSGTNGSIIGRDLTNTAKRIDIGYAAGINGGYISVQEAGVDWRPLFINPISSIAASVIIGKTTDDGVNKLQVVGNVLASQFRLSALNTAPATAASAGTLGEIRIDADYIYICTATNTWKRVDIATW